MQTIAKRISTTVLIASTLTLTACGHFGADLAKLAAVQAVGAAAKSIGNKGETHQPAEWKSLGTKNNVQMYVLPSSIKNSQAIVVSIDDSYNSYMGLTSSTHLHYAEANCKKPYTIRYKESYRTDHYILTRMPTEKDRSHNMRSPHFDNQWIESNSNGTGYLTWKAICGK